MQTLARTLAILLLLAAAPGEGPVAIHLAGDSTMAEKRDDRRPETGWGEALQAYFDPAEVRVVNHARNGRSTRTFIAEQRWSALVEALKPGDYVFIQFGHNDQSKEKVDRYTPPDDFRRNLARFVDDVRARQAVPVLFTPGVRRRFDAEGRFYDVHGVYPDLVRAVAAEKETALVDVHQRSGQLLRGLGAEASKALYLWLAPGEHRNYPAGLEDDTHFSPRGAEVVAGLVVDALHEALPALSDRLSAATESTIRP